MGLEWIPKWKFRNCYHRKQSRCRQQKWYMSTTGRKQAPSTKKILCPQKIMRYEVKNHPEISGCVSVFWATSSWLSEGTLFLFSMKQMISKLRVRSSLVVQWLRICLPMQGTRVRALVREDPTCHGATKPTCHNYWACALEPVSHNYWARVPRARAPQQEKPPQRRVAPARCN